MSTGQQVVSQKAEENDFKKVAPNTFKDRVSSCNRLPEKYYQTTTNIYLLKTIRKLLVY